MSYNLVKEDEARIVKQKAATNSRDSSLYSIPYCFFTTSVHLKHCRRLFFLTRR